jgi:hypothetical protein
MTNSRATNIAISIFVDIPMRSAAPAVSSQPVTDIHHTRPVNVAFGQIKKTHVRKMYFSPEALRNANAGSATRAFGKKVMPAPRMGEIPQLEPKSHEREAFPLPW